MEDLEELSSADFNGRWNPIFQTERNYREQRNWLQILRALNTRGPDIDIFFREYDSSVPSYLPIDIKRFCETPSPPHLSTSLSRRCNPARAWLDDREYSTGYRRNYQSRLTDVQLYECMAQKRFGMSYMPDVDRRLIYVPDLDVGYISALIATASQDQVATLKDAIWKHIALQTSIRVKTLPMGYPVFSLEFHLPYLALREVQPHLKDIMHPPLSKLTRTWTDLSFLNIPPPPGHKRSLWGLHAAQISVAVCGSDHTRWTGYAFVDTHYNDASADLVNSDELEDWEDDIMQDPFASDGEGTSVDADKPIWLPREYWLRNLDIRTTQVLHEWKYLAHNVKESIIRWEHEHIAHPSKQARTEIFLWIIPILRLLRQIRGSLSELLLAWKRFDNPLGDIRYFADLDIPRLTSHLSRIRETMEDLQCIERVFADLEKTCKEYKNTLEIHMNLETNEIGLKSNQINNVSHGLALRNSRMSYKSHKVNLRARRLASENLRTAQLATLINQLLLPLSIAVAYFGSQQEIFHFQRNQWTFVACVLFMMLGLKIYVVIFNFIGQMKWYKKTVDRVNRFMSLENTYDDSDMEDIPDDLSALGQMFPTTAGVYPVSSSSSSDSGDSGVAEV